MARRENVVQRINTELEEGWEAKLNHDGRIYYICHKTQTTSWLPPRENWTGTSGLPFGWETGLDKNDKDYFINHVDRYTTRDDPRQDPDYVEPPRPREVELVRDLEKGFGFVAGSEKPVVVRFVTEGGPSEEKLLPGDQILKINGEEVRRAPREKVIELVRSCKERITLTVCQPYTDNSSRKSALLTAAKKAKLKNNPSRVRFADAVMVNGASITNPSPVESYVPFMPNVLKVFLENGQTKSFKYDNKTTVKDVVVSLQEKLNIRCVHHFNLVLQNMKNNTGTAAKMTLLQEHETLAEIAARQGARYFRCLFRVTFVPKDAYDLLKEDPIAFEYFYLQCCNDVLHERFASEMKYDTALRLAALQIQQHAMSNNMAAKISIKAIVKECGLDKFVSKSLLESMKGKDLKRMLSQYLKMNQSLAAPGQKQLTALQAKLHYMKIVGELKTFGSRVFMVTLLDKKTEAMLLVGPHSGISIVTNIKSYSLTLLADFEHLEQVKVTKDGDNMHRVDLKLKPPRVDDISLGLLSEDAQNFVCLVAGYYRIFVDPDKRLVERTLGKNTTDPDVPSYESVHRVHPAPWSYPEDLVSEVVGSADDGVSDNQRLVDLSQDPPEYEENEAYLAKVKLDLGIESVGAVATTTRTTTAAERPKNVSTINVSPMTPYSLSSSKVKVNGTASPFEEGVTSFGTASSDSSSLSSSFSSSSHYGTALALPATSGLSAQPVLHTTIDLRRTIAAANGHAAAAAAAALSSGSPGAAALFLEARGGESERSSDTDSVTTVDTERRPLLGHGQGQDQGQGQGQGVTQNGDLRPLVGEGESDDTDSFGTPSGSPAKGRLLQRVSSVESGMHSFGLHSPDMLPVADVDFQTMSDVDLNHLPPEVYQAIYHPDTNMIPAQKLYFDPDIIDLTIFPLPDSVAEDESMIDFTALPSLPPPSFANSAPPSSSSSSDSPSRQRASATDRDFSNGYPPTSTGSGHPGLMRSASAGHCPDFFDSDIDSLIAQYYVPPPPSSSNDSDSYQSQVLSHSFSGAISGPLNSRPHGSPDDDDDFSSLIIPPPPPSSSTPQTEEVAVVPPVPKEAREKRRHFRHKRSSSVDIGSLNLAKQQLQEAEKRRSLDLQDSRKGEGGSIRRPTPPHDLSGVDQRFDRDSHDGLSAESPATVSMRLHNLLKSLPNFAPEAALADQQQAPFFRTGSLRIYRSASCELTGGSGAGLDQQKSGNEAARAFTGKPTSRTFFSGTASLGRNSGRRAVSHEHLISGVGSGGGSGGGGGGGGVGSKAGDSDSGQQQQQQQQQQTPAESFASLKAKLKDYRDHLLKRASLSRKASDESASEDGDRKAGKSSLRRSNSFSRLLSQLSGRRGSRSSDSAAVEDGNWTLRDRRSGSGESSSTGDLLSLFAPPGGEEEKRGVPVVRETLAVSRTSLRPVSTSSGTAQNKSKKSGPLKALSSVFASEEKVSDSGLADPVSRKFSSPPSPPSKAPSAVLSSAKKNAPNYASKDDLSMTRDEERKKKSKVKTNPYATIKMWRPITMTSSVSHNEDVYRSFTNFDVLVAEAKLPATGDLRNDDYHASATTALGRTVSDPGTANEFTANATNGDGGVPAVADSPVHRTGRQAEAHNGRAEVEKKRASSRRQAPPAPTRNAGSNASVKRTASQSTPSSAVTYPLKSRSLSLEEQREQEATLVPPPRRSRQSSRSAPAAPPPPPPASSNMNGGTDIPTDYPNDSSSAGGSLRSRSLSQDSRDSSEGRRGRSLMESSCAVVGADVSKSVKSVLSRTYGPDGFEAAAQDVETMLARLKVTMESLKAAQARVSSGGGQFQTVRQELQLQTKQFVQDAKHLVASATGSREAASQHLHLAMHTLARLLLHSQATMVRMRTVHQAQHVGFEVLKVSASFKSTVAAANAAMGRPTTDPHMKYLMRQATNLAGLLSTLLKTLKTLEQA